jgi:plasmid maintenance system antidote protein VapI
MDLSELLSERKLRPVDLARVIGCHKSYVSHVTGQRKKLTRGAALRIFEVYGVKLAPIENLTDAECRALARIEAKAA